jgi:hypothetical protein
MDDDRHEVSARKAGTDHENGQDEECASVHLGVSFPVHRTERFG